MDTANRSLLWDGWHRELVTPVQAVGNSHQVYFFSVPGFIKSRFGHVRPRSGIEAVNTTAPASLRKFKNKDVYSLNMSIKQ